MMLATTINLPINLAPGHLKHYKDTAFKSSPSDNQDITGNIKIKRLLPIITQLGELDQVDHKEKDKLNTELKVKSPCSYLRKYNFSERGSSGQKYYHVADLEEPVSFTVRNGSELLVFTPNHPEGLGLASLSPISKKFIFPRKAQLVNFKTSNHSSIIQLHSPYAKSCILSKSKNYELRIIDQFSYDKHQFIWSPIGPTNKPTGWELIELPKANNIDKRKVIRAKFLRDDSILKPGILEVYYKFTQPLIVAILLSISHIIRKDEN